VGLCFFVLGGQGQVVERLRRVRGREADFSCKGNGKGKANAENAKATQRDAGANAGASRLLQLRVRMTSKREGEIPPGVNAVRV